jgi:polysaccharide biosynthesis protein PslH
VKILFISHRLPFPPSRGGKIRPFQMIQHLGRSHTVVVASLAHSGQELAEGAGLKEHCNKVIVEVLPRAERWTKAVAALPTSKASSCAYFWSRRLRERILETARQLKPEVVWVHCAFMARYAEEIDCGLRILDYGDLDSGKWFEYANSYTFPLSTGYAFEGYKLRRYEKKVARRFDRCVFTAPAELEEFHQWRLPTPSELIPNGVDFDHFRLRPPHSQTDSTVIFLGRMDYFPNVQGAVHFARSIFPMVRKRCPAATFRIVGSNPTATVRALAELPGVTVTGSVSDVRPHLAEAAVAVAPLQIARGTQNKILEYMAVGVPVVSSPQASRGIQALAGEHFLVGETDETFCDHVVRLLEDSELRNQLAIAARNQIECSHSWCRSMKLVDELLNRSRRCTIGALDVR